MNKKFFGTFFVVFAMLFTTTIFAAEQRKVLSENKLTQDDYSVYAKKGVNITLLPTGANYIWSSNSDAEIVLTDVQNGKQEMTGGGVLAHAGEYVANSGWESITPSSAIFDLKKEYTLNRVDVWGCSTLNIQLGTITISVSSDGINYKNVGTYPAVVPPLSEIETNPNGQADSYNPCEFRDVDARYVKVTADRASASAGNSRCYQYVLGEILVMGDEKKEISPNIANLQFCNNSGNKLYTFSKNGTVIAKANITDLDASLIIAHYGKNGALKGVNYEDGRYDFIGVSYELTTELNINNYSVGDKIKTFIFDSMKSMKVVGKGICLKGQDLSQTGLISSDTPRLENAIVYSTNAQYEWIKNGNTATNEQLIGKESMLFDGNIVNTAMIKKSGEAYGNLLIHFDSVMQVEKATVYSNCSTTSYMSDYDMYASIDGKNYEYVATKSNTMTQVIGRVFPITLNVEGILYAKHLKFVLKKASNVEKMELAELEIYGKPPAFEKERFTNYSYEEQVPFKTSSDVVASDANRTILSDDSMTTSISSTSDYVSIIYSLGDYYQIEDITVKGNHSGCEILLSPDGVNYFTTGFYSSKNGITEAYGKAESNAKFVKFVFRKGNLDGIVLNEIAVFGRKLYNINETKNITPDMVSLRAELKPNNVLYLDWSDYNHAKNNIVSYKVYIEPTSFTSTENKNLKQVYCGGNPAPISLARDKFCQYAGLEPDTDYYVAVTPMTETTTNIEVAPIKIHTYSALGGEKLSGIFCINEYPYGGGSHVAHENEAANLQTKLKLINDMEVLSKTRFWENNVQHFNTYLSHGFSFMQYATSQQALDLSNKHGIYSFASSNEPDLNAIYKKEPQKYVDFVKENYTRMKNKNLKNILCDASICGTDKLSFLESLYQADPYFGKYYDVADVHAYCKYFEGVNNLDDTLSKNAEAYSIPEHLFAKVDKINGVLNKYNDWGKDIIFTETGWSTHTVSNKVNVVVEAVTKQQQANFVPRCYLISAMLGVKNVFLYSFQDEGFTTDNVEYQFGIVDWYGNPKPSYYTYYTLGKLMKDTSFVKRIDILQHPNYGGVFYDEKKNLYLTALWNVSGTSCLANITSTDANIQRIDAYGNTDDILNGSQISLGSAPTYFYSTEIPNVEIL